MEAKQRVLEKTTQIIQVLGTSSPEEVLTVITSVLAKLGLPNLPIQIVGNMAKVMNCDQVVITEEAGGWDVGFKFKVEGREPVNPSHEVLTFDGPDSEEEWEAEEYHEDDEAPDSPTPLSPELEEIEKESIRRALFRNHGSRKKAAEDLHISERTLYRKIEKYELMKEVRK